MNVVLIGFSGSGKSAVGRLLAQRLGWEFVDTDVEVERRAGRRIHEIFAQDGETVFRRMEAEALRWALRGDSRIVAVGGGAVVDSSNRVVVREGNIVVLLEAGVDTLYRRLASAVAEEPRPMLGIGGRSRIADLKAVRDPIYLEAAHLTVSTEGADLEEVASHVFSAVTTRLGQEAVKAEMEL